MEYVEQALHSGELAGDKTFSKKCEQFMEERFQAKKVLLTTSCTSALEMAAILCGIEPGDEVIMPSYTFVSTANAFLLRGAKIRFVDIREDTCNIDESLISAAITEKTKAIVPVHYASVPCEMKKIKEIAAENNLYVIEDAAQAVDTKYEGQFSGTIGDAGAFSFHETKNFVAGEGGALVVNREDWIEKAEIMREKGTNRSQFIRGQVDKYTWVGLGSSYVPSDVLAAVLFAQLEAMDQINQTRENIAKQYRDNLKSLEDKGIFRMPQTPENTGTNNHMFYLMCQSAELRNHLLKELSAVDIQATFHYIPLHNSPMAKEAGLFEGELPVTERVSANLIRLPMHPNLNSTDVDRVSEAIIKIVG